MEKPPPGANSAGHIIDLMRQVYTADSDRALAEALRVNPTAVSNWRKRGVPLAYLYRMASEHADACACWVMTPSSSGLRDVPDAAYLCWGLERLKIPATERAVNLVRRWAELPPEAKEKAVRVIESLFDALEEGGGGDASPSSGEDARADPTAT